jgi:hypothetical protein
MKPDQAFDTTAKLSAIRDCIIQPHPYAYQATPIGDNGWKVSLTSDGPAGFSIDLTPIPQGTHVETRRVKTMLHVAWDEDVQPCIDPLPRVASN